MFSERSWPHAILTLVAGAALGGCADNVCEQAADLCGASAPAIDGECSGAVQRYATCIVDRGECSATAMTECAGGTPLPGLLDGGRSGLPDGGLPGGDAGGAGGTIELRAHAYVRKPESRTVYVPITLLNHSESDPIGVNAALFAVETDRATVVKPTADSSLTKRPCDASLSLAKGGKASCQLIVDLPPSLRPVRVRYRDPQGRAAEADLPTDACTWAATESTTAACNDGCDNDGNGFFDCGDFACCAKTTNCPANTACGGKQGEFCPTRGPETSLAACSDGCDNDHNLYTDCNERSCCEARSDCPTGTYCGGGI